MPASFPEITLLNGMLGWDFPVALDRHKELGLRQLDLKDSIFGKNFDELSAQEAMEARKLIEARDLKVYTLSSSLCHQDIELGERAFRTHIEEQMKRVLKTASLLRPLSVRLLSAWSSKRGEFTNSIEYIDRQHPWLYDVYRSCIHRLAESGYVVFIENEAHHNILSTVGEIHGFFERLNCGRQVSFTWDIQNLWQMGTTPDLAVYQSLRDLIGYLHFKGGQAGEDGKLAWATSLEDASWPVRKIVHQAVADGTIPVFCLNPSHGKQKPGYDYSTVTERDIHFLQQLVGG